jgi:hypothetical protein
VDFTTNIVESNFGNGGLRKGKFAPNPPQAEVDVMPYVDLSYLDAAKKRLGPQ